MTDRLGDRVLARRIATANSHACDHPRTQNAGLDDVSNAFNQLSRTSGDHRPLAFGAPSRARHPLSAGVRHYLSESEGSGYWEYFKPSDYLLVSVTDAHYRQRQWIDVPPARLLKVRLLLSGKIVNPKQETILTGPQAHLHMAAGTASEGYFLLGGEETKLIVLHCAAPFVESTLGLPCTELPPPLSAMMTSTTTSSHRIGLSAEVFHAAQRILDSRHNIPSPLRSAYLESMATTIICDVIAELSSRQFAARSLAGLQPRDVSRIYEARDYLAQHFVAPPTIPQLARMVGMNQTKLKAGFKAVLGITSHRYVLERRMELASELLLQRSHNVTEIAYRVGYEYPTNFTFAFKRHFGCLPRAWIKQD